MTATTEDEAVRLAATIEADALQRAGQITLTQAKARVRDRVASPTAHLALQQTEQANRLAAALRELHSVCLAMDAEDEMQRPTEHEYQAAMAAAAAALARH